MWYSNEMKATNCDRISGAFTLFTVSEQMKFILWKKNKKNARSQVEVSAVSEKSLQRWCGRSLHWKWPGWSTHPNGIKDDGVAIKVFEISRNLDIRKEWNRRQVNKIDLMELIRLFTLSLYLSDFDWLYPALDRTQSRRFFLTSRLFTCTRVAGLSQE